MGRSYSRLSKTHQLSQQANLIISRKVWQFETTFDISTFLQYMFRTFTKLSARIPATVSRIPPGSLSSQIIKLLQHKNLITKLVIKLEPLEEKFLQSTCGLGQVANS